jgi:hypothetical protein
VRLRQESGRDGHFSQHYFKESAQGRCRSAQGRRRARVRESRRESPAARWPSTRSRREEVQRHAGRRRRVDERKSSGTLAVDVEVDKDKSSGALAVDVEVDEDKSSGTLAVDVEVDESKSSERWPSTVMSMKKVQE